MAELEAVLFDFGHTLFFSPSAAAILIEKGADPALAEQVWMPVLILPRARDGEPRGLELVVRLAGWGREPER